MRRTRSVSIVVAVQTICSRTSPSHVWGCDWYGFFHCRLAIFTISPQGDPPWNFRRLFWRKQSIAQLEDAPCVSKKWSRLNNVYRNFLWLRHKTQIPSKRVSWIPTLSYSLYCSYPIIKRRVAWLIGKWISDECYPANNVKIWDILSHLLQNHGSGTDMAVRLTAVTALRECVDVCALFL